MKISAVTTLLGIAGGCGQSLEVLHEIGGMGATAGGDENTSVGGTGAGGAAAGGTATGGAAAGGEAVSVCAVDSPSQLAALTMGQSCTDLDICEPSACAGMAAPTDSGTSAFVACRNHRVQIVQMTLLGRTESDGLSPREGAVDWPDCESALDDGVTGDICTWQSKSCVRHTSDACCLEGVECLSLGGLPPGHGVVHRVSVCAPGCTSATPDTTSPVVTDCASAAAADTCHTTPSCEGDFVCYRSLAEPGLSEYTESSQLNGAMWCAGGMLVGGYGLTWGL